MPLKCLTSLKKGTSCWIGRKAASDIVTIHPSISSQHCCLSLTVVDGNDRKNTEDYESEQLLSQPLENNKTEEAPVIKSGDAPPIKSGDAPVIKSEDAPTIKEPLIKRRFILQCTITDHSSNGTWLKQKKYKSTIKLIRGKPTEIKLGDTLYLLSPSHEDTKQYQYMLCKGLKKGELVICQLLRREENKKLHLQSNDIHLNNSKGHPDILSLSKMKENNDQELLLIGESKLKDKETTSDIMIIDNGANVSAGPSSDTISGNKRKRDEKEREDKGKEEKEEDIIYISKRSCITETVSELEEELERCPHCLQDYPLSRLIVHVEHCPTPLKDSSSRDIVISDSCCTDDDKRNEPVELGQCIYCNEDYPLTELILHVEDCDKKKDTLPFPPPTGSPEPLEKCIKCFCDFPLSSLITHTAECTGAILGPNTSERFANFIPSVHDVDALTLAVLSPTQQMAIDYVAQASKKAAYEEYPNLCMRVVKLGYTPKDLQKVLHWVRSTAPIIIHVNLNNVLHHLVKDTHYRNLFEIGRGGGSLDHSARAGWENNIFNSIYRSSPPSERVKYGVLNIVGDPCGVRSCYSYGDSFLQLKKVRLRTTFASMDTASSAVKLSCCEHYGNVLNEYSNKELTAILDVATHRKPYLHSNVITHYKEVQIHGPVSLSENIDCIVVNRIYKGNHTIEKLLDQFISKNKCNLIWMNDVEEPPAHVDVTPGHYGSGYYGGGHHGDGYYGGGHYGDGYYSDYSDDDDYSDDYHSDYYDDDDPYY